MGFCDSDLARECGVTEGEGVRIQHAQAGGCDIMRVRIETKEAAVRIGKPQGCYVTLDFGNVCTLDVREEERVSRALSVELREMARRICKKPVGSELCILVAGLGNAEMSADALGAQTVRALAVTRHLQKEERVLLSGTERCAIAAIAPGVTGQTGMACAELLRGAVWSIKPDLVIAVDALAARSPDRLASTVQLCDSGICPGSGVRRASHALTREALGVPVLALGVPTVIRCAALIGDVMGDGACEELDDKLRDLCVCPYDIDLVVARAARVLACAVEKAFCK